MKRDCFPTLVCALLFLLLASCPPGALAQDAGALPDSLLTSSKVHEVMYADRQLAERIVAQMRQRKAASAYETDRAEADIYYNYMEFQEAAAIYERLLSTREVRADDEKTMDVLESLCDVCSPDFDREQLIRVSGIDKNRLAAIIRQYSGTNIPGYINSKRVEYAASLMKEHPDYTLVAIAEQCGFTNQTTFIRAFKNAYGMTPSGYRNIKILPPPFDEADALTDKT